MENTNTEYKLKFSTQIIRDICAFLNTDGGNIYIGWNDKGEIKGIDNPEIISNKLKSISKNYFGDCLDYIKIDIFSQDNDKKYVRINIIKKGSEEKGFISIYNKKNGNYEYFFRIKNKNIISDKEHAPYWEFVGMYDLPIVKDYEPYKDKKDFNTLKKINNVTYRKIGELSRGNYLYKYMDLESALRSFDKKIEFQEDGPTLRFVEPSAWDDKYEGRFYNATYNGKNFNLDTTPFLYACCFSSKRENEAAWILYSHNRTGLASRCVEFTLNRNKLREQLVKNLKNCSIYIGMVNYQNKEVIDNIHLPYIDDEKQQINHNYKKYFSHFTTERYIELLLLKRTTFEHEKEVRIFLIPDSERKNQKSRRDKEGKYKEESSPKCKYVTIDWIDIIDNVKIDKNCTDYEVHLLQEKINLLIEEKKNKLTNTEYDNLKNKLQLKKFDPYADDSLKEGYLSINVNQI